MARRQLLPDDLSPAQVAALQDALLANADACSVPHSTPRTCRCAVAGDPRDEESGKAIALQ